MRFFYSTQLSEHIVETPEGFLLCLDVPIARTGWQEYGPGETTLEAGGDGLVHVERRAEDVFAPEAMASFEGKPFVIDHPGEDVTPANWRELAMGHAQDVHQGDGDAADLLLANLLVMDGQAIALIRGGLREISCGYDAEYEQTGPGRGRQRNIRGNHVALVAQGRCGGRCRINDNNHNEDEDMATTKKKSFADRFLDVFRRPEVRSALDSMEEEPAAPPKKEEEQPSPTDQEPDRLAALEQQVAELALLVRSLMKSEEEPAQDEDPDNPDGKDDPPAAAATGDSAGKAKARDTRTRDTRTVDKDTMDRAALLMPGIGVAATDNRCAVQRLALRTAARDAATGKVVAAALRGSTLDACDCVTLDAAFLAASEFVQARNNLRTSDGLTKAATVRDFGKPVTPAEINKQNRDFHAKKGA